uniref:Uncharacterized protein n=1 Tax=Siphoviridae sp. ct4Z13 TaxID=2827778 RepID=A0A8S5SC47_9CAUD|nr:MAG TPA: hypothetical protein [Siphoviridae sp. ct4Z13]
MYFCVFGLSTKISILLPLIAPPQSSARYSFPLIFIIEPYGMIVGSTAMVLPSSAIAPVEVKRPY